MKVTWLKQLKMRLTSWHLILMMVLRKLSSNRICAIIGITQQVKLLILELFLVLIDYVRQKLGANIDISVAEADASAMKTKYSFSVLGYDKICQEKNVKLINLSEGEKRDVPVEVAGKNLVLPINEILLNADLVINVPKLKTHDYVGTTCALKNMFGAISKPRKYSYHKMLSHVIVGVNKIVKSHITVVDGFIVKGVLS